MPWHERAAFSQDDCFIFSAGLDRTVRVWDAGSGHCVARADIGDEVTSMVVSPDATRLFTASRWNGLLRVWRLRMDRLDVVQDAGEDTKEDALEDEKQSNLDLNLLGSPQRVLEGHPLAPWNDIFSSPHCLIFFALEPLHETLNLVKSQDEAIYEGFRLVSPGFDWFRLGSTGFDWF